MQVRLFLIILFIGFMVVWGSCKKEIFGSKSESVKNAKQAVTHNSGISDFSYGHKMPDIDVMTRQDRYIWCTIDLTRYTMELSRNVNKNFNENDLDESYIKKDQIKKAMDLQTNLNLIYSKYKLTEDEYNKMQEDYAEDLEVREKLNQLLMDEQIIPAE